jgi:hypothetical protein
MVRGFGGKKPLVMTHITITWKEIADRTGDFTGNVVDVFYKTPATDPIEIANWINTWGEGWRYSTEEEIVNNKFEYFNPYVGEVNESTWN